MVGHSMNSSIHVCLSVCLGIRNALQLELGGWEIEVDLIFLDCTP